MSVSNNNSQNMNILAEKDLNAMEFNLLAKPAGNSLEFKHEINCQNNIAIATTANTNSQDQQDLQLHHHHHHHHQDQDKFEMLVSSLKLKIPSTSADQEELLGISSSVGSDRESSSAVRHHHDDDDIDGFKTPTSSERKIPAALKCPPAPRKLPKPSMLSMKRRPAAARRRILLDLSTEIEALFPPALLADLIGGKIKKFRQGTGSSTLLL